MSDFVEVGTFLTRLEAEIVKGVLSTHKIKSIIFADDQGGMYPFPMQPSSTGVRLMVNKKDYSEAKKLLLQKTS